MTSPAERAFWQGIKARAFERVYYLFGDDDYLKDAALRALLEAAVDPATRDFNLDLRHAGDVDPETLDSLLGTPPMMADRRVVVLRDVGTLAKDARAVLERYLKAPAPDLLLVLIAAGGEKAKPDKALDKMLLMLTNPVELAPLTSERIPKWIAHHVQTELGASITPAAIGLLHQAVGADLPALAGELDKLASYTSGAEIDEDAVAAVVGVRRGETLGDLLDCIGRRDGVRALDLLPYILDQPKMSAVSIVMALTVQTLALAWGDAQRARRRQADFFEFLKSGSGVFTGRPWGDAARAWTRALDHWSADTLDAALDALLAADVALKETRLSSDEQLLTTLVLTLCSAPPTRGASTSSPRHLVGAGIYTASRNSGDLIRFAADGDPG